MDEIRDKRETEEVTGREEKREKVRHTQTENEIERERKEEERG